MIDLHDVGFAYDATPVVSDVNLSIGAGELVCLLGKNGAGKTTLLRIIAGLLAPTAGTAKVWNAEPTEIDRQRLARRMAYLPQSYHQVFPYTAGDIVLMGRYAHRGRGVLDTDSADDVAHAERAMERCDVIEFAGRRFDQLSGGEQKRVLLAQALCQNAELLLLDEPTASLDPAHAADLFEALRASVGNQVTAVVVTHDLNIAARHADRVIVLGDATILADGSPQEVFSGSALEHAFGLKMHVGTVPGTQTPFVVPG